MEATIRFDTVSFNQALDLAVKLSSRPASVVINNHAFLIASEAAHFTQKADRARIAWQLGQIGEEVRMIKARDERVTKKGKVISAREASVKRFGSRRRDRMIIKGDSFGARIILKKIREGLLHAAPSAEELKNMVRRMITSRQGSVGFIASGFIRAARDLKPFTSRVNKAIPAGVKVIGRKGQGVPAVDPGGRFNYLNAKIINDALVASGGKFQGAGRHNPMLIAESGLRKAVAKEWQSLRSHFLEKYKDALIARGFIVQ